MIRAPGARPRGMRAGLLAPALLALAAAALPAQAHHAPALPPSGLDVRRGDVWQPWWRSSIAPPAWPQPSAIVTGALAWRAVRPGVDWAELYLAGSGEAWRTRAIVVRLDPAAITLRVVQGTADGRGTWTVDSAPPDAVVALNAGQFTGGSPWGWVKSSGVELYSPQRGPLATAFAMDQTGHAEWLDSTALASALRGSAREGFQSYPVLLTGDGEVPWALRAGGRGIDVRHRDARLALGQLRDGRLLVVLTRFDGLGGALDQAPLGLTTPEMAALMGALGCGRAVALDGGISAQLMIRAPDEIHRWRGLRRVPLALVVTPK